MTLARETVRVALDARSYDIVVGMGVLADAGNLLRPVLRRPHTVVVTDRTVARLHMEVLARALDGAGISHREVVLPPGEETKSFAQLEKLVDDLLAHGIERSTTIIAFGGGVVGDLAGFAASLVLRGVDYVQIPTTLLAQVDSSVGGKTAINTTHGKNLLGAFYQPRMVLADIGVLESLPRREFLAGYAEVAKYGLINDADFFHWLERHGPDLIEGDEDARREAVVHSCRAKAAIVAADEREAGERALLNLGHTFGHALEAESGFGDVLLHGEAVAIGMVLAFELSSRLGHCPLEETARMRRHLAAVGLGTDLGHAQGIAWEPARLLQHMAKDKKVEDGRMTLVLARGIGRAFLTRDVDPREISMLLEEAIAA